MGGFGSGSHWGGRGYLDDHISLDIRRWKRDGLLWPGRWVNWQWSVNDEPTDSIRARVEESCVVLIYRQRRQNLDRRCGL